MRQIRLDKPITYRYASLRFFEEKEHHVTRFWREDVLLLVYDGVLRFTEEGEEVEVSAGEYYIQRRNTHQAGPLPSDGPKYLYVHFMGEWTEEEEGERLPFRGTFRYQQLKPFMERMDELSHGDYTYVERAGVFFEILAILYRGNKRKSVADEIAEYIRKEYLQIDSLGKVCDVFHFSKNHIISLFKKEFGITPFTYINRLKIRKAMYLLEVTTDALESIAYQSGFRNYSHFYRLF